MAGPVALQTPQVPRRVIHSTKLSDTVARTEKYVTDRAQFDQTTLADLQGRITDSNGQSKGGIVNASDLPTRYAPYEYVAAIAPHVGDLSSQPSAVYYDGPLDFGTLPNGVNSTYGYVRWSGWLNIVTAGTYNFALASVGGANLFVLGTQIVGGLTASSTTANGNIALLAGMVPIVVEWQWSTSTPALTLEWTPPGGAQALIPSSVMSNSINQVSGYLVGYYWNGSEAYWMPEGVFNGGGGEVINNISELTVVTLPFVDSPYTASFPTTFSVVTLPFADSPYTWSP